ncbi:MAG TPA: hypothetical protein V6C52_02255 [Coleofasciculaceae cyanobacterium]
MFQHSRKTIITLAALVALQGVSMAPASAQRTAPINGSPQLSGALQIVDEVASGLKAYDDSALQNRTPLILVHGIGAKDADLFNWDNFLSFAFRNPEFSNKYKLYLYHYDSSKSVPAISKDLQHELKGFIGALGGRNVKILAYSEGGLLTRNAMQDPYIDEHTLEVLAIATPFHGSPLANPDWLQKQTATESPLNLVRMTRKIVYGITGKLYPTFKEDFHWDNFDGAIPKEQYEKQNGPTTQKNYTLAGKQHFITYSAYFGTEVDSSVLVKELDLHSAPPKEKPQISNLFKRNFLFSLIRHNIGKLPLADRVAHVGRSTPAAMVVKADPSAEQPMEGAVSGFAAPTDMPPEPTLSVSDLQDTENSSSVVLANVEPGALLLKTRRQANAMQLSPVSMMMFNDGISPISSQLWLGRYAHNPLGVSMPVEKLWAALRSLKGNPNTRLFPGIDHRNWMDGETRTGSDKVQDLLNPNEPPRTVFEWIVYDLMS